MDYSLSDSEIRKCVPGVKIMSYPELKKYSSLDDTLDSKGRVVILFLTEGPLVGHWTTLFKDGPDSFQWFDSYGLKPDGTRRWLSKSKLISLREEKPVLTNLIKRAEDGGAVVNFSPYHFQRDNASIETCGRHVACRLIKKHLSPEEYAIWVTKNNTADPDRVVTEYTNPIIHK
jgi:hypothetical protein